MRHKKPLTKDNVFVAVLLAIATIASIVGMLLAILTFLQEDRSEPVDRSPPQIERLERRD